MSKTIQLTKWERERVTAETLRSIRRRDVSTNATSALHQKNTAVNIYKTRPSYTRNPVCTTYDIAPKENPEENTKFQRYMINRGTRGKQTFDD